MNKTNLPPLWDENSLDQQRGCELIRTATYVHPCGTLETVEAPWNMILDYEEPRAFWNSRLNTDIF